MGWHEVTVTLTFDHQNLVSSSWCLVDICAQFKKTLKISRLQERDRRTENSKT